LDASEAEALERKRGVQALEKEHETLRQAHATLLASLDEAKKDFAGYERRDIQDKARLKQLQGKIDKLELAAQEAKDKHDAEVGRVAALHKEQPALAQHVKAAAEALERAESGLAELQQTFKGAGAELCVELEAKQRELAPLAHKARQVGRGSGRLR
jgi:chromosome segregation ATPase